MKQIQTLPRPYPDRALLESIREEGFLKYPERRENYLKFLERKRGEEVDYVPTQLDIEHISRCNYRCTMCQVSTWPKSKRAEDMSFKDFKDLIDAQWGLVEVKIQGMGEPLMNKDFFKMIAYAREKYLWVRSTTNAALLHLNDNYKKVLDSDICELQVSIDGTSKRSYEKIRVGGKFEKVKENCKLLNAYGDQIGKKRTRMWSVIQKGNMHELEEFPKLAAEMGFERLTLSLNLNVWGGKDQWREYKDSEEALERQLQVEEAKRIIQTGKEHGVEVTFWSTDEKYEISSPETLCPMPFERVYISSDMRIVPCAAMGTPEVFDLGDARELTEVWNSKRMKAFRRIHLRGHIPKMCQACYNMRKHKEEQEEKKLVGTGQK